MIVKNITTLLDPSYFQELVTLMFVFRQSRLNTVQVMFNLYLCQNIACDFTQVMHTYPLGALRV